MLFLNKRTVSFGPISFGLTGMPVFLVQKLLLQKGYVYCHQQEKQM
jgi:hypothetical protein